MCDEHRGELAAPDDDDADDAVAVAVAVDRRRGDCCTSHACRHTRLSSASCLFDRHCELAVVDTTDTVDDRRDDRQLSFSCQCRAFPYANSAFETQCSGFARGATRFSIVALCPVRFSDSSRLCDHRGDSAGFSGPLRRRPVVHVHLVVLLRNLELPVRLVRRPPHHHPLLVHGLRHVVAVPPLRLRHRPVRRRVRRLVHHAPLHRLLLRPPRLRDLHAVVRLPLPDRQARVPPPHPRLLRPRRPLPARVHLVQVQPLLLVVLPPRRAVALARRERHHRLRPPPRPRPSARVQPVLVQPLAVAERLVRAAPRRHRRPPRRARRRRRRLAPPPRRRQDRRHVLLLLQRELPRRLGGTAAPPSSRGCARTPTAPAGAAPAPAPPAAASPPPPSGTPSSSP
eukprot:Sspe_Gene.31766::Locus_15633_Transcript_7_8_Confidence_0.385_Length_2101::g.31766::m.31766